MKIENFVKQWLIENYSIPNVIAKRYAPLLIVRAIRFYLENELDNSIVSEDLYAENKKEEEVPIGTRGATYPNLDNGGEKGFITETKENWKRWKKL